MIKLTHVSFANRLEDLNGVVSPGDWLALCGPNGAGKSTLIMMMAGLLAPTACRGDILLLNQPLRAWSVRSLACRRAVYAPLTEEVFPLSVDHVLKLAGEYLSTDQQQQVKDEVVAALSMDDLLLRVMTTLSTGELQRVHLARCFIQVGATLNECNERVLFLDEPLSHLDYAYVSRVLQLIRRFCHRGGSVVMSSHQLHYVQRYCNRVWMLKKGRLVSSGATHDVLTADTLSQVFDAELEPIIDQDGRGWWVG